MEHKTVRQRFDLEALDLNDPFELDDDNFPHLAKHAPFTARDVFDAWEFGGRLFYPAAAGESADWLMVARLPGHIVVVPVAPSRSGDPRKCRPIGIYEASVGLKGRYERDLGA